jgi:hypothetical protein
MSQRISRVKRQRPCAICGKLSYCGFKELEGRTLWICMWVKDGAFARTRDGKGWMHFRDGGRGVDRGDEAIVPGPAPLHRRHTVYENMLSRLTLSDDHILKLKGRGLTDEEIAQLGYRSVRDVAREIAAGGFDLTNVPGFYNRNGRWSMLSTHGYFIPVRDRRGSVQALQIRRDTDTQPKYVWFSRPSVGGASSGTPVHRRPGPGSEILVTESPLKADYVWIKNNKQMPVLGVAGVWTGHNAVCEAMLEPGIETAVVAFDGNWRSNSFVVRALITLLAAIKERSSVAPHVMWWESEEGIDDAYAKGLPTYRAPATRWFLDHEDLIYRIAEDNEFVDIRRETLFN